MTDGQKSLLGSVLLSVLIGSLFQTSYGGWSFFYGFALALLGLALLYIFLFLSLLSAYVIQDIWKLWRQ